MSQTPQTPGSDVAELISGSNGSTSTSPPSTVSPGSSAPSAPNQPTAPAVQPSSEGATQVSPTKATYQVSFFGLFSLLFLPYGYKARPLGARGSRCFYLHRTLYLGSVIISLSFPASVHIFFYLHAIHVTN